MINRNVLVWYAQVARFKTLRAYSFGSWKGLPIRECSEPLVQVPPEYCHPFYAQEMKVATDTRIYLREGVLGRFLQARALLNECGYDLKVYDGWRSMELQASLFWIYMKMFTLKKMRLDEKFADDMTPAEICKRFCETISPEAQILLKEANRTYVSWPSREPEAPSPHATGGAVDVWLYHKGLPANLGVPFDWMEESAGAFYHLKRNREKFPGNDREVARNRNLLIYAMTESGFSCYGPEIWHFNYGNQMDSLVSKKVAMYGYIEP